MPGETRFLGSCLTRGCFARNLVSDSFLATCHLPLATPLNLPATIPNLRLQSPLTWPQTIQPGSSLEVQPDSPSLPGHSEQPRKPRSRRLRRDPPSGPPG